MPNRAATSAWRSRVPCGTRPLRISSLSRVTTFDLVVVVKPSS
jgi:hypothetical protein